MHSPQIARHSMLALTVLAVVACGTAGASDPVKDGSAPRWRGDAMSEYEKPTAEELEKRLTPLQLRVTQQEGTEPPFRNEYWDEKRDGIYVDVVSGEPLFASVHKYDSKTGWPSFWQPLEPANIVTKEDRKLWMTRVEVRSKHADSHLGHVFDDGPAPTGLRYCMNSAAMRFVPVEEMEALGYGDYLSLFTGGGGEAAKGDSGRRETAYLAGGCFWGMEELLRSLPGVVETEVGYTGGKTKDPAYPQVHAGATGHAEAVKVVFDPERLSYEDLLLYYFRIHDPTTLNRQGNDIGTSYRSAVFYLSEEQRRTAESVRARVDGSKAWKRPVVTEIAAATPWYSAEDFHQDYLQKNPGGYTCHFERDLVF